VLPSSSSSFGFLLVHRRLYVVVGHRILGRICPVFSSLVSIPILLLRYPFRHHLVVPLLLYGVFHIYLLKLLDPRGIGLFLNINRWRIVVPEFSVSCHPTVVLKRNLPFLFLLMWILLLLSFFWRFLSSFGFLFPVRLSLSWFSDFWINYKVI